MIQLKQFTIEDIPLIIKRLGSSYSSSDNMESFSQNSNHVLLYNEMMKYSKEELEKVSNPKDFYSDLFNSTLGYKSYLAFAALMEKRCFSKKIGPFSNWCLNNLNTNFELYEFIYYNSHINYEQKSMNVAIKKDVSNVDNLLYLLDKYYLSKLPEDMVLNNVKKVYEYFKTNHIEEINEYCFKNFTNFDYCIDNQKPPKINFIANIFLNCMKDDGININKHFLMNSYLPKDEKGDFFISSGYSQTMKLKLEAGYIFNEREYTYQGKRLLENLLSLKEGRLLNLIGPYIHHLEPLTMTVAEQSVLLEKFTKIENYEDIISNYLLLVEEGFSKNLPQKDSKKKKKL